MGHSRSHGGRRCLSADVLTLAQKVPADTTKLSGVLRWATDPERADRLWGLSEKLRGVAFAD
jgi:hypothetical protein